MIKWIFLGAALYVLYRLVRAFLRIRLVMKTLRGGETVFTGQGRPSSPDQIRSRSPEKDITDRVRPL